LEATLVRQDLEQYNVEELFELERLVERDKCKEDLLYLCKNYLGYEDLNPVLHKQVADHLNKLVTLKLEPDRMAMGLLKGKKKGVKQTLIMLPRTHLKSALVTIGWVIQQILVNPNITICIINATFNNAAVFLKEIQEHLRDERLVALFPEILCDSESAYNSLGLSWRENLLNVKRTKIVRGHTVEVFGIDKGITSRHFDIMIFDDIQDDINSATIEGIQKVVYRYRNCYSVLNPGGIRIIIGTRWKKGDFYDWLIEQGYIPLIKSATVGADGKPCSVLDPTAQPIFPEKFTIQDLRDLRKEQGAYFYSCQYENNPLPDEEITFKDSWLKDYVVGQEPEFKRIYILCDPALSKTRTADETVISIIGQPKDETKPLHVLNSKGIGYVKTRGDVNVVVDELFQQYEYFSKKHEVTVGVETVAFQGILKQWIEKEMKNRKQMRPFTVVELKTGNRQKMTRIQRLQPLFENGGILLHPDNCETLKTQLKDWPSSIHDDHPDALAYILDVLVTAADVDVIDYMGQDKGSDPYSLENVLMQQTEGGARGWRSY
jgi:predicted phage terminase large subunit-like protein